MGAATSMRLWKCRRQLHDIAAHSHVSVDPGLAPLYLFGFFGLWTGLSFFQLACKVNTHTHNMESLKLGRKDMITARYFNLSTIVCSLVWATLAAWVVDCVLLTRLTKRIFAHLCGIAFNIFQLRPALSSKASTPSRKLVHSSKWIEVRNCLALMQTTSSCPSPMSYRVYHNGT